MSVLRRLFATSCLCVASGAVADPVPLSGQQLTQAVSGSLIALDTPADVKLPIRFSHDGFMSGEAGELASYLGSAADRGRWWVKGDQLCYKWFRWFESEQHCITVKQDGSRIHWVQDDGKDGTATIVEQGTIAAKAPTGRSFELVAPAAAEPIKPPAAESVKVAVAIPAAPIEPVTGPAAATEKPAAVAVPAIEAPLMPKKPDRAAAAKTKAPLAMLPPAPKKRAAPVHAAVTGLPKSPLPKDAKAVQRPAVDNPVFRVSGVEEDDILNVRSGPSEYHAAVGAIPPSGRGVRITGSCQDDWCPIRHHATTGWVNRYYLVEDAPQAFRQPRR